MKIDSIKDPRVVLARQLATSKGRLENNALLLEGVEHIQWALQAKLEIEVVFVHDKIKEHALLKDLEAAAVPYFFMTEGILKKVTDTNYLVPFVGVAKCPVIDSGPQEFTLVLDNLVDYGNIGTIVRSALAFGIKNVMSTTQNADFFFKKIIDASRGKIFETHVQKFNSAQETIQYLKAHGYQIISTSPHAKNIQSLTMLSDKPVALVLGNETDGCSDSFINEADLLIQIPMSSEVESLNVAVAAGISMYELKIKLVIAMLIQKIYKNLGRQLGVTVHLVQQAFDAELKKVTDFSANHVILLMILKCDQHMSMDQVTRDTGEHGQGLQDFLTPLITSGYISKTVHENVEGIVLTKSGEEFIAKLWPVVEKSEEKILENFSEVERAQLVEYLSRIQDNCSKMRG